MQKTQTDVSLWDWRYGQTQAERLAADILQVEGFVDIDPQCPLGGPDGRKDILCARNERLWLAAVYFPPTRQPFNDVAEKFLHDFKGVAKNNRQGFAFFTNQRISPNERAQLSGVVGTIPTEIFHQERLRSILDSPKGYGLRLEYLRIPMAEEEQLGLWSLLKDNLTPRLIQQEAVMIALHRKVDQVLERTMAFTSDLRALPSTFDRNPLTSLTQFPTADLRLGHILWIHRLICDLSDIQMKLEGRLRSVSVWIGRAGSTPETARFVPCPPEQVKQRLDELIAKWRADFPTVSAAPFDERLYSIVAFHHKFLNIHPFLDANGRVARALLQQQLLELTGRRFRTNFSEATEQYYYALNIADAGDINELITLISANLE
jgi:fido (protein-threonine AMPylation protein)